jgi:hypothetical protein
MGSEVAPEHHTHASLRNWLGKRNLLVRTCKLMLFPLSYEIILLLIFYFFYSRSECECNYLGRVSFMMEGALVVVGCALMVVGVL